jgi:hypothetical protein
MFLTKIPYWLAGFACGILIFIALFFITNDYSFYTKRHNLADINTKPNLHYIYLACKAYWAETKPTNACNVKIASLTTYGYIQSSDVVIWGDGGTATDFSVKGKSRLGEKVYTLENKVTIRELKEKELESALAEMKKQAISEKIR